MSDETRHMICLNDVYVQGTSLITCGDFENARLFLKKTRFFSKTVAYFFKN